MTLPIRIMSRQFELFDEVDLYESLQITRSWHSLGQIELRINRYLRGANQLLKGRIIFPHNHLNKAYIIRHREVELDENGKATENWVIRALPLKSWLGQRITYPPSHTAYDNKQDTAENVMRHYVNNNVINPVDSKRRMSDIVLAASLNRGPTVNWQSRFKNLAEELTEISLISGLGWNVEIDKDNKRFVFKVLQGRDLTVNQSVLPPAIFSPEFNTLGQLSYVESELDYKNFAIVAGQGEGTNRRIVNVGDSSGFERYELFVDARDVEEVDENDNPLSVATIDNNLRTRGQQKLMEHEQELYLEGQALTESKLVYEKDYNLGDLVTLQNKEWGVTRNARITEVKEIYEPGVKKIELVFGQSRPTLIDKIKQQLSTIKPEVTR